MHSRAVGWCLTKLPVSECRIFNNQENIQNAKSGTKALINKKKMCPLNGFLSQRGGFIWSLWEPPASICDENVFKQFNLPVPVVTRRPECNTEPLLLAIISGFEEVMGKWRFPMF